MRAQLLHSLRTLNFRQVDLAMEQYDFAAPMRAPHGRYAWFVIAAMIGLVDLTLFRSYGFAGPALFFPVALALLLRGRLQIEWRAPLITIMTLLLLLCCSMAWSGGAGQIAAAIWLVVAGNLAAQGVVPYMLETIIAMAGIIPGGYEFLHGVQLNWRRIVLDPVDHGRPSQAMNYLLPIVSVIVFGSVFVLANPDVIKEISSLISSIYLQIQSWMSRFSAFEIVVWCLSFWFTGGLLCPVVRRAAEASGILGKESEPEYVHPMFGPFRNTLMTLIGLFTVYLFFEFCTLWFRKFPEGFHYSGYAHEGSAWLTVALGLATLTLSLIFRGCMMNDQRLGALKKLAWIWSGLNFLLAASVYNRLQIYVDFNGMTRMRVVGFLGISAVVGGFLLVLLKIMQRHKFIWLIRRQVWVLSFVIYLYITLPVDILVHRYNVKRIMAGSPEPCVQISEHPISIDAIPQLIPLLDCEYPIIVDGVQATLRSQLQRLESIDHKSQHWTGYQFGTQHAFRALKNAESRLNMSASDSKTLSDVEKYREFAMKWW